MIDMVAGLRKKAATEEKGTVKLVTKLKKTKPNNLDDVVHNLHDDAFREFDCLTCANCCKTTSPAFYQKDIERLSKRLKMKPGQFIEQYLNVDEDDDYVLKSAPCPFLDNENHCLVYEDRPTACREYPHTNRKRFYQVLDLSVQNSAICPVVNSIFEKLKEVY
jgi:Fe-S-cluster containining protein